MYGTGSVLLGPLFTAVVTDKAQKPFSTKRICVSGHCTRPAATARPPLNATAALEQICRMDVRQFVESAIPRSHG
jgi:hypothetical protein